MSDNDKPNTTITENITIDTDLSNESVIVSTTGENLTNEEAPEGDKISATVGKILASAHELLSAPLRAYADTSMDRQDINLAADEFHQRVLQLTETLLGTAEAHAISRLAYVDRISQIVQRSNNVETMLLRLCEALAIEIPINQIDMTKNTVTITKVRLVTTGNYKMEQLLHAAVLALVEIERRTTEIVGVRRQIVDLQRGRQTVVDQLKATNTEVERLRKLPPPATLDEKPFVLYYQDAKGRPNFLRQTGTESDKLYRRTRLLPEALRFTTLKDAAMALLDVLNHPGKNAFPTAYRLGFFSVRGLEHKLMELNDSQIMAAVGAARTHAEQYESENSRPPQHSRKRRRRNKKSTSRKQ